MYVDKASFFLALGTLAVGGAAGYAVSDRRLLATTSEPTPPATETSAPAVAGVTAPQAPAAPACDDMTGAPADCPPPPYSADESGCAPIATKRCEEFKQALKPRVAERAVACLLALSPAQRCDPNRVNLCGHVALMNACSTEQPLSTGGVHGEGLGAECQAIAQSCPSAGARDCEATLSGMTEIGRERTAHCLSAHCADRGLLGCEGAADAK